MKQPHSLMQQPMVDNPTNTHAKRGGRNPRHKGRSTTRYLLPCDQSLPITPPPLETTHPGQASEVRDMGWKPSWPRPEARFTTARRRVASPLIFNHIIFIWSNILNYGVSMIAMSDKRINENQFSIPFAFVILLVLHSEETSHRDVIVVNNFAEPF